MIANVSETHLNDPAFQSAMKQLQTGSWEAGLQELDQLVEKYPLNHQLRTLRQEMRLRARIDQDELEDHRQAARRKARGVALRSGFAIIFLTVVAVGALFYSSRIRQQFASARSQVEGEIAKVELAVKFRDAQDLLQVGRYGEARILFEQVASANPEYPGLSQAVNLNKKMIDLEKRYVEAVKLMDQGEMTSALEALQAIQAEEPYYKDVSIRIDDIQGQFFLGDIYSQAEKSFAAKDWTAAAAGYETLRALNPNYQTVQVDDRLFNCYMSAAVQVLSSDSSSLDALDTAEIYFRKALALRPQDPVIQKEREHARQTFKDRLYVSYVDAAKAALVEQADSLAALAMAEDYFAKALELKPDDPYVQTQRQMARDFIQAQDDFAKGNWTEVISSLEVVLEEDPAYAGGTARQTLYDAYIGRGNTGLLSTFYEDSLVDYQRAAMLAEQAPQPALYLFQAQIKIAEVQGILGEYETAVTVYRAAIQLTNLNEAEMEKRPELTGKLKSAEQYAGQRNYRTSYKYYRDAARAIFILLPQVTHIVQDGEYITQLAAQYNTTVEAILQANNLGATRNLAPGRTLSIPVQP